MKDAHDPRNFVHYEKLAPDGTVLAVVEFEDGTTPVSPDEHGNVYVEMKR